MVSVGGCSVRSAWISMERTHLVLSVGLNSHSTFWIIKVRLKTEL